MTVTLQKKGKGLYIGNRIIYAGNFKATQRSASVRFDLWRLMDFILLGEKAAKEEEELFWRVERLKRRLKIEITEEKSFWDLDDIPDEIWDEQRTSGNITPLKLNNCCPFIKDYKIVAFYPRKLSHGLNAMAVDYYISDWTERPEKALENDYDSTVVIIMKKHIDTKAICVSDDIQLWRTSDGKDISYPHKILEGVLLSC